MFQFYIDIFLKLNIFKVIGCEANLLRLYIVIKGTLMIKAIVAAF